MMRKRVPSHPRATLLLAAFAVACSGRDRTSTSNRANAAERPYHSVSNLPAHRAQRWVVVVPLGTTARFQVGELRAADLPLPQSSPWKCRIDHASTETLAGYGAVTRSFACSNDDWRSSVEATAGYCATEGGCKLNDSDVVLGLQASAPFASVDLLVGARAQIADAEYPELP